MLSDTTYIHMHKKQIVNITFQAIYTCHITLSINDHNISHSVEQAVSKHTVTFS